MLAVLAVFAAVAGASVPTVARAEANTAPLCVNDRAASAAIPAAWSRPAELEGLGEWEAAAFRGLSCSRCNSATQFCVLNPIRYEYACAPLGSVACISSTHTHWCPASRGCWAGRCR
jgi:hypothetical protein